MSRSTVSNKSAPGLKPNRRYQHGFAIIRIDDYFGDETPIEQRITVKKVVRDAGEADREVERLNNLRDGQRSRYVSQITRIDDSGENVPEQGTSPANRIRGLISQEPTEGLDQDTQAWLESIIVPPYLSAPPGEEPGQVVGYGFPAYRAFEVCKAPSVRHCIQWAAMDATIFIKNEGDHADVACVQKIQSGTMFSFAYRVFHDLCDTPLSELTPLAIVEKMSERFGLMMDIGGERGRFFLESLTYP